MNDVANRRLFDQVVEIVRELREQEREAVSAGPTFTPTPAQSKAILEMADFYLGFQVMGKVAIWAQKVVKYVGWLAGGVLLYKGWTAGWFKFP